MGEGTWNGGVLVVGGDMEWGALVGEEDMEWRG